MKQKKIACSLLPPNLQKAIGWCISAKKIVTVQGGCLLV